MSETISDYERGRRDGRREAFEAVARWCDVERAKVGAVDGYDYRSGIEFAYRQIAIRFGAADTKWP